MIFHLCPFVGKRVIGVTFVSVVRFSSFKVFKFSGSAASILNSQFSILNSQFSILNYEKGVSDGGDLLSHTVAHAVPSAQTSLTAVFGMGTGVASLL